MLNIEFCCREMYVYSSTPPPVERPPSPLPSVYDFANASNASIISTQANSEAMCMLFLELYRNGGPYPAEKRQKAFELIDRSMIEVEKINTHRGVSILMREWFKETELRPIEERLEDAVYENSEMALMLWGFVTGRAGCC